MSLDQNERYPRLSSFLALKGHALKSAFTLQEVAAMFDVSVRTIQNWTKSGHLNQRDVPGRAKIFPADVETLFANSDPAKQVEEELSSTKRFSGHVEPQNRSQFSAHKAVRK